MRKLFIHNPVFRLLSPVFSGVMGYLLILLINNNVGQLQEQFLGQELYVCIGLSYIIQEFSRGLLLLFNWLPKFTSQVLMLSFQLIISLLLSISVITISISTYYTTVLGFSASYDELFLFNAIFCSITFIYILLYTSHQYLFKVNTQKLESELLFKQNIEEDFKQFKRGINPNLLFESFEVLLMLIKENKEHVDDFIDHLSSIYRFILSSKRDQLVAVDKELEVVHELIQLYNHLPYRKVILAGDISGFLVVPGSVLFVVEKIIRTTIVSPTVELTIHITEETHFFELRYVSEERLAQVLTDESLLEIKRVYSIYNTNEITFTREDKTRSIRIPKLEILTS